MSSGSATATRSSPCSASTGGARAALVEERIALLRRLWSGEEVDVDGRRVRVTPLPFTPGGPLLAYGGGHRGGGPAGRHASGCSSWPRRTMPRLEEAYRAEGGASAPGCFFPPAGVPLTVFVADDPERAWAEIGEYLLWDAASYPTGTPTRGNGVGLPRHHVADWRPRTARTRSSPPPKPGAWLYGFSRWACSRSSAASPRSGLALPRSRRGRGRRGLLLAVLGLPLVPGRRRGDGKLPICV